MSPIAPDAIAVYRGAPPQDGSRLADRKLTIIRSIWLGVGLACLGLVGLTGWLSWQSRLQAVASATAATQTTAQILDQHAARTIDSVEIVLHTVGRELDPRDPDGSWRDAVAAHLADFTRHLPYVEAIKLLDGKTGRSLLDISGNPQVLDPIDLDAVRAHARDPKLGLYVGPPMREGTSGAWVVGVSRHFEGGEVVVAHISLAYFQRFYDSLDLGPRGAVAVLRDDGLALARRPYVPSVGQSIAGSTLFREMMPARPFGTYEAPSAADGIFRIFSYRRMTDAPMVLVVSVPKEDVLAAWRDDAARNLSLALATSAAIIVFGVFLTFQIRRRDRADVELRTSIEFANSLLRSSADCIKVLDLDGRLTFMNEAGQCLMEVDDFRLIAGTSFADLFPAESRDLVLDALQRARLGEASQFTAFCPSAKGTPKWWEIRVAPVWDSAGVPDKFVLTSRDITERQRQSEELRAASEAKGNFLASMSHEIRTPLNGILGYTELLLEEDELNPDQRRYAERIQIAGSSLLTIVNDILDFSKIEAGEVELSSEPFSTRALIDNAVSIVRSVSDKKKLPIRMAVQSGVPDILVGDEARLRQVILNLLNNAVKFTPEGQVTIEVTHEGSGESGERLRFAVVDTGIGIPEDKRERLFKRFSQVDGSNRREFGGTGLGLAISKQLVELMGGEIGVESRIGEGSTFWFTVALARGEMLPKKAAEPKVPQASTPLRILLVEDLEINQEIARSVLEAADHSVDVVSDGAEAVMAVQAAAYDVVLMDIQMPGMDGITATRRIRELPAPVGTIPIIAITANVLPEQVTTFRQAGMNDHVGKPLNAEGLYAAIDRWGRRSGASAASRAVAVEAAEPIESFEDLDRAVYGNLVSLMGKAKVLKLLDKLGTQLVETFEEPVLEASDRERLARDAHAMVSTAGMLGFVELSELCSAFEQACRGGLDLEGFLARVRDARRTTLDTIAALRQAA